MTADVRGMYALAQSSALTGGTPASGDHRGTNVPAHPAPAANPRPTDDALQWQLDRIGSTAWEGWDLKFQRLAYGFATDTGVVDTREALLWLMNRANVRGGKPPKGKLVWYLLGEHANVMSSLDDGRVVGPGVDGAIGVIHYERRDGYVGWSDPIFP
jgi:hypothetical protein